MDESDGDKLRSIILPVALKMIRLCEGTLRQAQEPVTEAISDLRSPRFFPIAREDKQDRGLRSRINSGQIIILLLLLFSQNVLASNIAGFSGTSTRFTSDPLAAGTGGITLFHNSSTNSYSQNPASLGFLEQRRFDAGLVQLSLDRFIYTVNGSVPMPPTAHLGVGVIAAGTRKIEGRDSRGYYAGDLSDTEMTYLVSFSNRFSDKLAIGLTLKLLSKKLASEEEWFELKGSGFGAGLGILFKPLDGSTLGLAIKDWNSSYKWKTQDIFDQGSSYLDEFPMSLAWGWLQEFQAISLALEHDHYFVGEDIFRAALMWNGIRSLQLNAGMSYEDNIIIPGMSARYKLSLKKGPMMHIDLGFQSGVTGEGLRNYLGWGVNF
jgi:hypothetical protein